MSSHWRPFVPDQVVELVRHGAPPVGAPRRWDAVVLFADIAGFTAMSEALCAAGRQGTEDLSRRLNVYFGHLVERVVASGGSVMRFAGDAVTAVFPADAPRRAVRCALEMRALTGDGDLTVKIGLADGSHSGVVVGAPAVRLEYVVMGDAVNHAVAAEQVGAPGEILVDQSLLDVCDGMETGERRGRAHLLTGGMPVDGTTAAPAPEPVPEAVTARLAPFLHPPVAARLLAGRRGLVDEHREVTVAFVTAPSWTAGRFQHYAARAVRMIGRYGGHLLQIDTGDKGNLLVVCFGAPVCHEDDEDRAVRCCLALLGLPGGPFRAGLTTAFAYCGEVGSQRRREYLVVGDSVNLAARLMQAARPGQLLVTGRTRQRLTGSVTARALPPLSVKGKSARIPVWAVEAVAAKRWRAAPAGEGLIGRAVELELLRTLVERVVGGAGQVVSITGEAGVGKTRLADEAVRLAVEAGFAPYRGAAHAHETETSYFCWRPIWRLLLGVSDGGPLAECRARVREYVTALDGGSAHRAPLLAPAVNIPMPDTELTSGLDPATRTDALHVLLADVLRSRAAAGPIVLVLEDCHWTDPASAALLDFLAGALHDQPVLLLATARPAGAAAAAAEPFDRHEHCSVLALRELSDAEAERLVAGRLRRLYGERVLPCPELLAVLVSRGAGNPFYLEELASLVHSRGVDPGDPNAVTAIDLPDTLRSLLTARLDQLDEGEQAAVKVASVIGQVFTASCVLGSYPELGGADAVRTHLDRLCRREITTLRHAGPDPEYAFRHVLTQEAVYDTLTFAMRAQLHESVAGFVERTHGPELTPYVDVLAHHYGRTGNRVKQITWFRAAGDAARSAFANETAIGHYQRLLPLLPSERRGEVLVHLGTVWHLTGQWSDAESACREALEVASATQDRVVVAKSQRDLGLLCTYRRAYADAVSWLTRAGEEFERLGDTLGVASTLDRLSFAHFQQGRYAEALATAERHLALATAAGDENGRSTALENMGMVHGHTSNHRVAIDLLGQALAIAEDAGNLRGVSYAANDLAGVHLRQGDHVRAMEYLERARAAAEKIGFRSLAAVLIGNAGELYREQGDHPRAVGCLSYALRIALDLGDWHSLLGQLGNLGLTTAAQGRFDVADRLLDRAVELARALTAPYVLCEYLYWLARLRADQGRGAEAARCNDEALEISDRIDHRHHRLHCRLLALRLGQAAGRLDRAAVAARLTALLPHWLEPAEQAAIHAARWAVTGSDTDRAVAVALYRSLYERAPNEECRERLAELTDEPLPPAPMLPPLPAEVTEADLDLDTAIRRIDLELRDHLTSGPVTGR
ncbi:tetratricopeptide repeat protein [Actinophytocola sp.]|uniref:tetratricopeptide repeat protein n=1 Tax=Actinophytocola sp. TaxID=1872138 RepID=UPI00389B3397